MKHLICILIIFVSTVANANGQNGVAMMICSEVSSSGKKMDLTIVLEQTNSDDVDGSVMLDEDLFQVNAKTEVPVEFKARIFKNIDPLTEDLADAKNPEVLSNFLMSNEVPSNAYEESDEPIKGSVHFKAYHLTWGVNQKNGSPLHELLYVPLKKDKEFYSNSETFSVHKIVCEKPFLKKQEPLSNEPLVQAELQGQGTQNAEVEQN